MGGVVAVVPARGGSKGIPRKNLKPLGGLPLVSWAIRAGLRAQSVDRVVLSTDDEEIARVGRQERAEVRMRPPELATDKAGTMPLLEYLIEEGRDAGEDWHTLVLLEPTSPFRSPALVDECVRLHGERQAGSVISVVQLERNPRNIFAVEGDAARRYVQQPATEFQRRQDFSHLKRLNGCVYVAGCDQVLAGKLVADPVHVVEMSAEASANIDEPHDLELAALSLQRLREQGSDVIRLLEAE